MNASKAHGPDASASPSQRNAGRSRTLPALAVETAFTACMTEEDAIYTAGPLPPGFERRTRVVLRTKVKDDLLRSQ